MSAKILSQTYGERAAKFSNISAKCLLLTMERKKSNLCVSVDVTRADHFLQVIDAVGPYTCLIKTHIDIIEDFEPSLITRLQELSAKHDFMIFEDRKFADIGNTATLQYSKGVHKIASWAHITNAHSVAGPWIIPALASVGLKLGRGLLLLAEMSSKGTLATGAYTDATVQMAREHRDFVIGFIAQRRMEGIELDPNASASGENEDFLVLTPGLQLDVSGDTFGQQYRTPKEVVLEAGCDVIIVGRGIYGNGEHVDAQTTVSLAEKYREAGWKAYEERLRKYNSKL